MYCHRCGQYALDPQQPFWKYVVQYFENVYQFDGKVWTTMWMLFRWPGLLTTEFIRGRIASYVHPMRLLMFISVVFFVFFFPMLNARIDSLVSCYRDDFDRHIVMQSLEYKGVVLHEDDSRNCTVAFVGDSLTMAQEPAMIRVLDCVAGPCEGDMRVDTLTIRVAPKLLEEDRFQRIGQWRGMDLWELDPRYETNAYVKMQLFRERVIGFVSGYAPLITLLFIPFLALMSRVLFRRRRLNYMAHFVFALHFVSFVFLLLFVQLAIGEGWIAGHTMLKIFVGVLLLYLIIAARRVYEEGWIRSGVKSLLIFVGYVLLVVIGLGVVLGWLIYCERELIREIADNFY